MHKQEIGRKRKENMSKIGIIGAMELEVATLKKNMCNKATLELVRRIKENFMK